MVPSFAVGRTQEIVYALHALMRSNRIPRVPIYVDSPLAIETTTVGLPLPRVAPGSMTISPCEQSCPPVTLEITTASQFFVGTKPVSFTDLRTLALSSSANAVVFYDLKTKAVTRIVVTP